MGYVITATVTGDTDLPALNFWSTRFAGQWFDYGQAKVYPTRDAAAAVLATLTPPTPSAVLSLDTELPVDDEGYHYRDGARVTACCAAAVTFHEATLCCKSCWHEVDSGLLDDPQTGTPTCGGRIAGAAVSWVRCENTENHGPHPMP